MSKQIMSTDSDTFIRQHTNYQTLIVNNHIEDTPLIRVIRGGKFVEVSFNDLTDDERRAMYVAAFNPCGLEVY